MIPPPGAEPIGGTDAPTLLVAGPRLPGEGGPARMAVAWDLLPEMARLGWYGLRWEPAAVSTAIDPYTADRMGGKPTRRAKAEPVGQGMLF